MKETLLHKKDMTWYKMLVFLCYEEVYSIVWPGISCHPQNKWWDIDHLKHQSTEVLLRLERHHPRALSIDLYLHSVIKQTFWCPWPIISIQHKSLLSTWVKNYGKFLTHAEVSTSLVTKRFISKAKTDSCTRNTKQTMKFTLHIYK